MNGDRPDRPDALEVNSDGVAGELKARNQWLVWGYEWKEDREEWSKVPKDGSGGGYRIDATDPENGVTFDVAVETYESGNYDGLGYITDGDSLIVGFDWDDCRDPEQPHGSVPDIVGEAIADLDTYTEVSPSGTGYRQFAFGTRPDGGSRKDLPCDPVLEDTPHLEMYDGTGGRYLTVTGQHVDGTPEDVETRPQETKKIHEEFIGEDGSNDNDGGNSSQSAEPVDLDDRELIEEAKNAGNGDKFRQLWNGNTAGYPSQSEADAALCSMLAFWTAEDAHRMDRLFRDSGLMRDKWDEDRGAQTYGERTIQNAIANNSDVYNPSSSSYSVSDSLDSGSQSEASSQGGPVNFDEHNGCYGQWYTDEDGESHFDSWCNFTVQVESFLTEKETGDKWLELTVIPSTDEDPFTVEISPAALGDFRKFRKEVLAEGLTTTFDGGSSELNRLKEYIGTRQVPERVGTHQMGYHDGEIVLPTGVIGSDGWEDDPSYTHLETGTVMDRVCSIDPDKELSEDDIDDVRRTLRLLPETRDSERFLSVVGWFYASALRPLVMDWEGEFNHLNVLGDTEAGKTSTLTTLWQLFGMDAEPMSAKDESRYTLTGTMASSSGVPLLYDEYKPGEMATWRVKTFHDLLRSATIGSTAQRGNADGPNDVFKISAPLAIAGEQRIQGPAEKRRCVMTTFRRETTTAGSDTARAFAKLNGDSYRDENGEITRSEPVDFDAHALAYYQWIAAQDTDELRDLWDRAGERAANLLERFGVLEDLGDAPQQGIQTVLFGMAVYRQFALDMGLSKDEIDEIVPESDIADAVEFSSGVFAKTGRVSHVDRFIELCARASSNDYLAEDEHYTFVHKGTDREELRINTSKAFDRVTKFVADFNITGEDLLNRHSDYRSRFSEAYERSGSYVVADQQRSPPIGRALGINVSRAENNLEDFTRSRFSGESEGTSDEEDTVSICDLDAGMHQERVIVTVAEELEAPDWLGGKGYFSDDDGNLIQYEIAEGADPLGDFSEGDEVTLENFKIESRNGVETVVLSGISETSAASINGQVDSYDRAATDGGQENDSTTTFGEMKNEAQLFVANAKGNAIDCSRVHNHLVEEFGVSPEEAEEAAEDSRLIYHGESGVYSIN
ncbi:phage NrS-1 polymerase family protein [Natronococcus occultus]|uniref:NrS-1 polymerase-like HBD domain-containing protein n=1 Tax=Natronococcus occultus SP4 TaxID=694430 RepID=L0K617_9EURY|nr:DUF927 domain-containing protein [Natronococcus occultus]AGB39794.1 hypothetical protein Natoc_4374 [Natronococcus occultus SP4]